MLVLIVVVSVILIIAAANTNPSREDVQETATCVQDTLGGVTEIDNGFVEWRPKWRPNLKIPTVVSRVTIDVYTDQIDGRIDLVDRIDHCLD